MDRRNLLPYNKLKVQRGFEVSLSLSEIIRRNTVECAASHPWIDPWGWTWASTDRWDMANANWEEIDAREPNLDLIGKAIDLAHAGDFAAAIKIWKSLAAQGSVRSMIELGTCYEFGCGVPLDLAEAEMWYKQALAGGAQYAMLKCANFAASRQDFAGCDAILRPGTEDGWASAAFWQAWYRYKQSESKESYRRIFPLLKMAAKCGHPGGQSFLANFAARGKFGALRIPIGAFRVARLAIAEASRHWSAKEISAKN